MNTESTLAAPSLSGELKTRTAAAHHKAERHTVQVKLVRGELSRGECAAYLTQLHAVWEVLDRALTDVARRDSRVASMLRDYHVHAPRVVADIERLGGAGVGVMGAARSLAGALAAAAERGSPQVVGAWYVLEGSANGGQYIAKALARGLDPSVRWVSFDPHGTEQRPRWQEWRESLDRCEFSAAERDAIVAMAEATFGAMEGMMSDLVGAGLFGGGDGKAEVAKA